MSPRLAHILVALLCPALALAWGQHGHRIVGEIAQQRLTPRASAAVAGLLAGEREPTLAGVSNWADALRWRDPELFQRSKRWHFVNFHDRDCHYVPARDCPHGDCIVAATQEQLRVLADTRLPREQRAQALKFVVHFIGDIHQPLHAGNRDDRGGNEYQIRYRGHGTNLHKVWDGLILGQAGFDPEDDAQRLAKTQVAAAELRTDARAPERWARESCLAIDANAIYPPSHRIDRAYLGVHRSLAEQRLLLAGARLAAELNAILK
ncbi:MAG: S1/P1 nuclease [Proteobacteria bacterium]|nr:S1/P1 nuclease [Pseudomonadota bacterium]